MQVAELAALTADRHALPGVDAPLVRLNDTVLLFDLNLAAVKMLDSLAEAEQRLLESDRDFSIQVVADTPKVFVLLLLHGEDEVAAHHVWDLLALLLSDDAVAIGETLIYLDVDRYLLGDKPRAAADRALLGKRLALATALVASVLHLHREAGAHLDVLHDDASSLALRTGLQLAVGRPGAAALATVDVAVDDQLACRASIHFLQAYVDVGACVRPLLHVALASVSTSVVLHLPLKSLQSILAGGVEDLTQVVVGQDLGGAVDLLEHFSGLLVARVLVWVVLFAKIAKCLLDLALRGVLLHLEQLIIVLVASSGSEHAIHAGTVQRREEY